MREFLSGGFDGRSYDFKHGSGDYRARKPESRREKRLVTLRVDDSVTSFSLFRGRSVTAEQAKA